MGCRYREAAWSLALAALLLLGLPHCEGRMLTLGQIRTDGTPGGSSSIGGAPVQQSAGGASALGGSSGAGGTSGSSAVAGAGGTSGSSAVAGAGGASGSSAVAGAGGTSGGSSFEEPLFGTIELVTELAADSDAANDENPTLTSDQLEVYFTSTRDGGLGAEDVWVARRTNGSDSFDAPELVTTVNTANPDSSPAISLDGQTLWLGVERDGGLGGRDIWRFSRTSTDPPEFGTPVLEATVNSTEDDIPRPLGNQGLAMPLASRRGGTVYTTYIATRESTDVDFSEPVVVSELVLDGYKTTDAFLTDDGLSLFFVRGVDDTTGDLYVAHRETVADSFGTPIALSTVNQDTSDERDPWLSPDGNTLYFVSDRDGPRRIYRAVRTVP